MSIDKINGLNNINGYSKINKSNPVKSTNSSDSVSISTEAMDKAEKNRIIDMVNSAPDVRADRVAEVKQKLQDPNYIDDILIGKTADSISDMFGI